MNYKVFTKQNTVSLFNTIFTPPRFQILWYSYPPCQEMDNEKDYSQLIKLNIINKVNAIINSGTTQFTAAPIN